VTEAIVETGTAETESIGRKAGRGLGWGLLGNGITRVGSFATSLVMARLLVPHDFGVYAVALAAMQFVIHINDVGLIPATIQWRGKLDDMAPTAATLAASFSFIIYAGFWFAAPSFAQFSGVPEATPVIRLFTATILIDGITAVRSAYLLRTFQQGRFVLANAIGITATAVVGPSLALAGAGAMALAGGQLAGSVVTGVLVFVWARLPLRVGINWAIARKLMIFGIPLTVSLAAQSILEQSDKVIVGRVTGAAMLGFYLLAANISNWAPGMIGSAIRFVTLPGFARLSEKDENSLSSGVSATLPLLVLGMVPIAVLIAVMAEPTITFLYGAKWLPAAEPLRFLMILMVVRMVTGMCEDIFTSTGKTQWTLFLNLGWATIAIPALWFGTKAGGATGAAIAHAAVGILVAIPLTAIALHRVGVGVGPVARRIVRPLLAGALAGVTAFLLDQLLLDFSAFVRLAVAGTTGLLVYLVTAIPRNDLRLWIAAIRRKPASTPEAESREAESREAESPEAPIVEPAPAAVVEQ
jgi:O-antigen/teichoic acid export membrane protein